MPKVYNKHHGAPPGAIFIGRPGRYGNPYIVGVHGERGRCVKLFEKLLDANPQLHAQIKEELRGKDLVCFCAPRPCHGDILLKIANSPEE